MPKYNCGARNSFGAVETATDDVGCLASFDGTSKLADASGFRGGHGWLSLLVAADHDQHQGQREGANARHSAAFSTILHPMNLPPDHPNLVPFGC
jgi:hypothetical protein